MERIQILYEETVSILPAEIESQLLTNLQRVISYLEVPEGFVSIYFCTKETSQALNVQYRGIDRPTDVLSWSYLEQNGDNVEDESPWGELAVCLEVVRAQAIATGWELLTELLRLTIHGLVHLLGIDHETEADEAEMLEREVELLSLIGLGDLYQP